MRHFAQLDLFSKKSDLKIIKVTPYDIQADTDTFRLFKKVVYKHESMYPDIEKWLKRKVLPGIATNERVAYLGFDNEKPIVSAIVKKGRYSKFCHLHIDEKYQNKGIGDIFFSMMAIEVRNKATSVHFTLPENLWVKKSEFFKSFGFKETRKAETQYRNFEEELICDASFEMVWNKTLEKLPKIIESCTNSSMNIFNGLLFSIKPRYAKKLMEGEKIVEIRKRFNPKWRGCRAFIYSTNPSKQLLGHAKINEVDRGDPSIIWKKYGKDIGCSEEEYFSYASDSKKLYALTLGSFVSYISPIFLEQLSLLLKKDLKPPQSYLLLENSIDWAKAISVAEILNGKFRLYCNFNNDAISSIL